MRTVYSLDIICGDMQDDSCIINEAIHKTSDYKNTDLIIKTDTSRRTYQAQDIKIRISGNGFLYNMVRIIAGTLVKVGYHFYPPEYVLEILNACDRKKAGPKAPAEGLKLIGIKYDPKDYEPLPDATEDHTEPLIDPADDMDEIE